MYCKARSIYVFVALTAWAAAIVAGCAVEVPKSALPAFRLTPPTEPMSATKPETTKPTEARDS